MRSRLLCARARYFTPQRPFNAQCLGLRVCDGIIGVPADPAALRRHYHAAAGSRHLRQRDSRLGLRRHRRRLWMQHRLGEPKIERVSATVAWWYRRLRLAVRAAGRASKSDMEMLGVAPPGPYL